MKREGCVSPGQGYYGPGDFIIAGEHASATLGRKAQLPTFTRARLPLYSSMYTEGNAPFMQRMTRASL